MARRPWLARVLVAMAAVMAVSTALLSLRGAGDGVTVTRMTVGNTPVTIFRPAATKPAPVVVIAHGFAGSQQLMQPFALTRGHPPPRGGRGRKSLTPRR